GPIRAQKLRKPAELAPRAAPAPAGADSGTIVLPQRNDRTPTRRPRPRLREDRLQRGPRAYLLAAVVTMDSRLRGNERSMVHALVCPMRLMPSLRKRRTCCGKVNLGNGVTAVTSEARGNDCHVHLLKFFWKSHFEFCRVDRTLQRAIRFLIYVFRKRIDRRSFLSFQLDVRLRNFQ